MRTVGIDLGIRKIAMAYLEDEDLIDALAWEYSDGDWPRDRELRVLGTLAHDWCEGHSTDSIWIEDVIIGNNRKYSIQLAQTLGAVMSHLAQLRMGQGTDIRRVDNKMWKKGLIGSGNTTKVEVRDYINVTHSAYAPLCGDDQDLYDAACVGLYGHRIMERSTQLQL